MLGMRVDRTTRCGGGGFWAEALGTVVRSARFPLPVGDHGRLGQGSVCQPGSQGPVRRATVN